MCPRDLPKRVILNQLANTPSFWSIWRMGNGEWRAPKRVIGKGLIAIFGESFTGKGDRW